MSTTTSSSRAAEALSLIGYVLGVSYPVLALSTGARAVYQLFFKDGIALELPPLLSAAAALCYLTAAYGFFTRRRWAWRLSLGSLTLETALTCVVGALSLVIPDVIGRTVWRHFGADYGFVPLVQPLLGLAWLAWPETLKAYGLLPADAAVAPGPAGWWRAFRSAWR